MKFAINCLFVGALLVSSLYASAVVSRKDMLTDVDFINRAFLDGYAGRCCKEEIIGWNFEEELDLLRWKITQTKTLNTKTFQQVVKRFFQSARDYHVGVTFYSTESASLPFRVRGSEGRYFFTYVDPYCRKFENFPFIEGDELIFFDGETVDRIVMDLRNREVGINQELTDCALAEIYLTNRLGALGHSVPKGTVKLVGKRQGSDKQVSHVVSWKYTPEKMSIDLVDH